MYSIQQMWVDFWRRGDLTSYLSNCSSFEIIGSVPDLFQPIEYWTNESPSNITYLELQRVDVSSLCNLIVSLSTESWDDV